MYSKLVGLFANDIAMDLGTSNIVICTKKDGLLLSEPAVVAFKKIISIEKALLQ